MKEKVIENNLRQFYGFPAAECVQTVVKANETVSIGTLDMLFGNEDNLGNHPCMDGMWY